MAAYGTKLKGHPKHFKGFPISTSEANHEDWQPNQRLYLTMAPIGSCLYLLAGCRRASDSSRTMSKVHIFDTSVATDAWRSLEPIEEEGLKDFCTHCCVVQL